MGKANAARRDCAGFKFRSLAVMNCKIHFDGCHHRKGFPGVKRDFYNFFTKGGVPFCASGAWRGTRGLAGRAEVLYPGGIPACSRWLSEARATPPEPRRKTPRTPEVCQPLPDALTHRPLAPLPGCGPSRFTHPVVSLRSTTGYKLASLRDEDDQGIELARVIAKNKVERRVLSLRVALPIPLFCYWLTLSRAKPLGPGAGRMTFT